MTAADIRATQDVLDKLVALSRRRATPSKDVAAVRPPPRPGAVQRPYPQDDLPW